MDDRRSSGLWQQNADGYYDKATKAPFKYYEPPSRKTFSERTSNNDSAQDAAATMDNQRIRDVALKASEKIQAAKLSSMADPDMLNKLHEYGGDADAAHFSKKGHARSATIDNGGGSRGVPLRVDPEAVPANVRGQPWEEQQQPLTAIKTNASSSYPTRRGSVPDRSPLQQLELTTSKEEKRARMEQAEHRSRQRSLAEQGGGDGELARSTTLRSEKGRVVSDGSRRPSESTSDKYYRQVSAGAPQALPPTHGQSRFGRASEAMRNGAAPAPSRDIRNDPRPYHHAPAMPLSMSRTREARPTNAELARSGTVSQQRDITREPQPYHHAPPEPRDLNVAQYPHNENRVRSGEQRRSVDDQNRSTDLNRTASGKYKHRLRDAGFVGAATMAAGAAGAGVYESSAADRGKAAYDRSRLSKGESPQVSPISPTMPSGDTSPTVGRSGSRKLQKRYPEETRRSIDEQRRSSQQQRVMEQQRSADQSRAIEQQRNSAQQRSIEQQRSVDQQRSMDQQASTDQQRGIEQQRSIEQQRTTDQRRPTDPQAVGVSTKKQLQTDRMGDVHGSKADREAMEKYAEPDPLPREQVATATDVPVNYKIPPQTAAGQAAREAVGFQHETPALPAQQQDKHHHHLRGLFHRDHSDKRGYQRGQALEDWRSAQVARLTLADVEFEGSTGDGAWWEGENGRRKSSSGTSRAQAQYDGPYEEEAKLFRPPMFLKCGPLLRYTGIRKESGREIWRGSVMIVTEDEQSDYSTVPTLRIFAQPMELHQPPPKHIVESGQEMPPEDEDPVAGQVKISRTGRPLYVRPAHDLEGGVDLSREENNEGLYSATRTPMLGPQNSLGPDGRQSPHITFQDKSRIKGRDGEKAGRHRELGAIRLHTERGFTFWRWSIEIELGSIQHRVAYRINKGPAIGFWVPARGETMNMMFHSCNGFSLSVDPNQFSGPDPLWRDVLNRHQSKPFHVMIGGGDQIYNDAAMRDTTLFREWLQTKNPEHKHGADFSGEMQEELENFYFNRYSMWFSQGLFAMAESQIPMVNMWDDHDIIDGFGSYPHHFMSTRVFAGLGAIAFKYYMLFQHQSLVAETEKEEPAWVLGASPGPYINELSRHIFLSMGPKVKLLGVDCRTERMRDEVLSQESYDILFERCRREIRSGETRHLLVLLGVPIAYPRLNFLENILTSRVMDPIKAIGRTGMLGGFINKFDGGVEILDDLDDHWTAKHHKAERNWFIQELQELAAEKSVRVTILGGDVHLSAVGQFYTPKKYGVQKDRDHRYMPNVISSAIVNTPPPTMMADVLNKRNKVHHLDHETDEDLIPMFEMDVDGGKRNNKCLLNKRNYCTIREFQPGSTPPPSPPPGRDGTMTPQSGFAGDGYESEDRDRRFPPGSMRRTFSLGGGPGSLMRRLSGSKGKNPPSTLAQQPATGMKRTISLDGGRPGSIESAPQQRPTFMRRPTTLSVKEARKAAAKGGAPDEEGEEDTPMEAGHINLESGLDFSLNMEIDQTDPGGNTQPYRLLVPALWYTGAPDVNNATFSKPKRGVSLMDRLRGRGKEEEMDDDDDRSSNGSLTPSPPPSRSQTMPQTRGPIVAAGSAAQQRARYGADGAYDDHNDPTPRGSMDQSGGAFSKGYNLSQPPIGSSQQQVPTHQQNTNTVYQQQQSNHRSISAPVSQKHSQQGPYGRDECSEDSLTASEEYDDGPPGQTPGVPPRRRLSKAEKFFGIGDEGGRKPTTQNGGGYVDATPLKAKPRWMVWR